VNGSMCLDLDDLEILITDYFSKLFKSSNISFLDEVIGKVPAMVSEDMNEKLCFPYSAEEVEKTLKQMHPSKAPGLDELNPFFY